MTKLLLRGGRVIDPANDREGLFDILIADGKIAAVERGATRVTIRGGVSNAADGRERIFELLRTGGTIEGVESRVPIEAADAATIDVTGMWVMPGLIDPHVHLRDPGFPQKETIASGLRAAAAGGFTCVAAMANTSPVNDTPEITRYMIETARNVRGARLVPVAAVTRGLKGAELTDFCAMTEAGARMFSDDGISIDDPMILTRGFENAEKLGLAISLHEEDRECSGGAVANAGPVSKRLGVSGYPNSAEAERIRRDLGIALGAGAAAHIAHLSCAESVDLVRAARKRGAKVTCEVTPHHLFLGDETLLQLGPDAKMNPPLRSKRDIEALRAALADRTIDMIATDHAPHDPESKRMTQLRRCFPADHLDRDCAEALTHAANGIVGLETALGLAMTLVHEKIIAPMRLCELMSLNPARLLRIEGGTLSRGAPADVTIIDPNREWTVDPGKFLSLSRNTPFAGTKLRGKAMMTIVAGEIVFDERGKRQ